MIRINTDLSSVDPVSVNDAMIDNIKTISISDALSGNWKLKAHTPCKTKLLPRYWKKPLKFSKLSTKYKPLVLFCHDMKGGYFQDNLAVKSKSKSKSSVLFPKNNIYTFHHWGLIDIFNYFGHAENPLLVPTPHWIHAAHSHGVRVWGTFITEWDHGASLCEFLFSSEKRTLDFAREMKKIALYYNFDGWLINIENSLSKLARINFIIFLKELNKIFPFNISYYDSLDSTGNLKWQDSINDENLEYHKTTQCTFLNYSWNLNKVTTTITTLNLSKMSNDGVYFGFDVFGRYAGHPGGIKVFESSMVSHLIRLGFSLAIFAPGWAWESFKPLAVPTTEDTDSLQLFSSLKKSKALWGKLQRQCVDFSYPVPVCSIPFSTNFSLGIGFDYYFRGTRISKTSWNNLQLSEPIPILPLKYTLISALHSDSDCTDDFLDSESVSLFLFGHFNVWEKGNSFLIQKPGNYPLFHFSPFDSIEESNINTLFLKLTVIYRHTTVQPPPSFSFQNAKHIKSTFPLSLFESTNSSTTSTSKSTFETKVSQWALSEFQWAVPRQTIPSALTIEINLPVVIGKLTINYID